MLTLGLLLPFLMGLALVALVGTSTWVGRLWRETRPHAALGPGLRRSRDAWALNFVLEPAERPGRAWILRVRSARQKRASRLRIEGAMVRWRGSRLLGRFDPIERLVHHVNEILEFRGERRKLRIVDWDVLTARNVARHLGRVELWPRIRLSIEERIWLQSRLSQAPARWSGLIPGRGRRRIAALRPPLLRAASARQGPNREGGSGAARGRHPREGQPRWRRAESRGGKPTRTAS